MQEVTPQEHVQEHSQVIMQEVTPQEHVQEHGEVLTLESIFTEASDEKARQRIRYELLVDRVIQDSADGDDSQVRRDPMAFLLHDVLSKDECEKLMKMIDDELEGTVRVDGIGNRECDRAVVRAPEISEHCLARARPFLEQIVKVFRVELVEEKSAEAEQCQYRQCFLREEDAPGKYTLDAGRRLSPVTLPHCDSQRVLFSDERSLDWQGSWELDSMKESVTCLRYRPGDHFDMHEDDNQDGPGNSLLEPVKSLFTGLLYLNSDFTGGNTNFMSHAENHPVLLELNPADASAAGAPGSLLFFFQKGMLHEGHKLQDGKKYVIRSDLFYRQVEKAEGASSDAQRGLELLQEARELFALGDFRWQKKYTKACELNPAVLRMTLDS